MEYYDTEREPDGSYTASGAERSETNNDVTYHYAASQNQSEKPTRRGRIIALVLCCTILGMAAGFGGGYLGASAAAKSRQASPTMVYEGERETQPIDITKVDTSELMTPAEVYAQNVNSTVGIRTSITSTNFWGYQTTSAASGSGFIISSDGYILTNFHVIESSNSVTVTTYDGTEYDAEIIGYDQSMDIAVLKIDAKELVPVVLGRSETLNVGDDVIAIGNPLGELTFSLTRGVVSALDRQVTLSGNVTMELIQTDCAINSGNSGGALFNMYGEVVGITNAKYSSSSSGASIDNIGFAIPVDDIRDIVDSIITNGYIVKPYIGVSVSTVSSEATGYGLPGGASVQQIAEGSPAEKAGLQVNDIITAVNGTEISSSGELVEIVGNCAPGDELTLSVYRQGETLELTLTVGEQSKSALEATSNQQSQQQTMPNYGGGFFGFPWGFFG